MKSLHLPSPRRLWGLKQQLDTGSLTEGGPDAAVQILGPVDLLQGLHCVLGKLVLQDYIQRVRGRDFQP